MLRRTVIDTTDAPPVIERDRTVYVDSDRNWVPWVVVIAILAIGAIVYALTLNPPAPSTSSTTFKEVDHVAVPTPSATPPANVIVNPPAATPTPAPTINNNIRVPANPPTPSSNATTSGDTPDNGPSTGSGNGSNSSSGDTTGN